jgi:muramidase (phage lysozyme)
MARIVGENDNVKAFLDMIAWAEGTSKCLQSTDDGYDVEVGGTRFEGYDHHPFEHRAAICINKAKKLYSTAAGRYQFLRRIWDYYAVHYGIVSFRPVSQDLVAIILIRERRAYDDLVAGKIKEAIEKCSNIWASLPGNDYGQHTWPMDKLVSVWVGYGGIKCIDVE